jgi:hypothetical protein
MPDPVPVELEMAVADLVVAEVVLVALDSVPVLTEDDKVENTLEEELLSANGGNVTL